MKSAWKINRPNANPAAYSTTRSIHIGKPQARGDHRGGDDAGGVAGDAVDRRADALLPQGPDELLVRPRLRFLVGHDVEGEGNGPM
jgi:hypothetical protein